MGSRSFEFRPGNAEPASAPGTPIAILPSPSLAPDQSTTFLVVADACRSGPRLVAADALKRVMRMGGSARTIARDRGEGPYVDARSASARAGLTGLAELAVASGLDVRDLESGLVRLELAHGRTMARCPGDQACMALQPPEPG